MTNNLVKRLRWSADGWDAWGEPNNAEQDREAADRIEALEKQLFEVNDSLEVTITETMTGTTDKNWKEFCEALIEQTRELLGGKAND